MEIAIVYKAKRPALIKLSLVNRDIEKNAFEDRCNIFKRQHGLDGCGLFGFRGYDGSRTVEGATLKPGMDLPEGWRWELTSKGGRIRPAKKTQEGKRIAKDMEALSMGPTKYPGVPTLLFSENHAVYPHVHNVGDKYFLILSKEPMPDVLINEEIDLDIWEKTPTSNYYLALEELEAQAKKWKSK